MFAAIDFKFNILSIKIMKSRLLESSLKNLIAKLIIQWWKGSAGWTLLLLSTWQALISTVDVGGSRAAAASVCKQATEAIIKQFGYRTKLIPWDWFALTELFETGSGTEAGTRPGSDNSWLLLSHQQTPLASVWLLHRCTSHWALDGARACSGFYQSCPAVLFVCLFDNSSCATKTHTSSHLGVQETTCARRTWQSEGVYNWLF